MTNKKRTKNCISCLSEFEENERFSNRQWEDQEYCSRKCSALKRNLDNDKHICNEYLDGASSTLLGLKYSMSPTHILRILKEHKIKPRTPDTNKYITLWKGGLRITEDGYFRFHKTPANGKNSGRRLHCIIAESIIGRSLKKDEVVHHIDKNKLNNHPDNLMVMLRSDHTKLHHKERGHHVN